MRPDTVTMTLSGACDQGSTIAAAAHQGETGGAVIDVGFNRGRPIECPEGSAEGGAEPEQEDFHDP